MALLAGALMVSLLSFGQVQAKDAGMLIDDFSDQTFTSQFGTKWRAVSDQVMGGVSEAAITHHVRDDLKCLHLTGDVRLDNNGGFVQAAVNLSAEGGNFDASAFTGIRIIAYGNNEQYSLHLRTADNTRPWQSYRAHFEAQPDVQTLEFPFAEFVPYRISEPLDVSLLRRIGVVAIGREFTADLKICRIEF